MQRPHGKPGAFTRNMRYAVLCVFFAGLAGTAQAFLRAAPASEGRDATSSASTETPQPRTVEVPVVEHEQNPLYDQTNAEFRVLQAPREALQGLPRDQDNKVDWMEALRTRAIVPRASLDSSKANFVFDLDVVMRNTKAMPFVKFPHRQHTEWLDCGNCHPSPFEPRAGANQIKMEDIFRGRFCGACHDRVAFVTHRNCFRCHSVPQPGAAAMGKD